VSTPQFEPIGKDLRSESHTGKSDVINYKSDDSRLRYKHVLLNPLNQLG